MELWLLGAGAIVLIAITVWIVWPAHTADPIGKAVRDEEVLNQPMMPAIPPQGDRFEDQYTSATADLSPGGIAAAVQSLQDDDAMPGGTPPGAVTPYPSGPPGTPTEPAAAASPSDRWPESSMAGEHIGQASKSENFPYGAASSDNSTLAQPRSIGLPVAALLALACAAGGAWLYARWQRERNKPINRLRRGARDVASRLGERIPQVVDDLPRGRARTQQRLRASVHE